MEAMVAKTGISMLIMLFGFFQDGLGKLESKDYAGAIAAFTKVIDHRQADADLRAEALFWRAMAYGKLGTFPEAKADLAAMLALGGKGSLRTRAFATFADLGGDPGKLLPKETPKQAFEKATKLAADKDLAGFRQRLDGSFAAMLAMMETIIVTDGHGDPADEIASLCRDAKYVASDVGKGKELGLAQGRGTIGHGQTIMIVQLVACGDEWHFATLLGALGGAEAAAAMPARAVMAEKAVAAKETVAELAVAVKVASADVTATAVEVIAGARPVAAKASAKAAAESEEDLAARLKQVVTTLALYASTKEGNFPGTLDEIRPMLGDKADLLVYTDPASKERGPLLYHRVAGRQNPVPGAETYVVAAPWATGGKRLVAFADGRVVGVPEAEFLATAKEQGWNEVSAKPLVPEEELKEKVAALVKQLGDAKPAARKAAYRELRKLRKQAEPILQTYRDHPDPEVRLSIRELLKKKQTPEVAPNQGGMMGGMGGAMFLE
jgi:tetratricopeptide (TPR) repeat protein